MPAPMVREALLEWFDRSARDLPWRRTGDPWAIWVSEVMLQQTRVETVIPYYQRFLARFPTPRALAEASEDEVLGAWSGLGYYRRARLLHRGAREVVARYGGEVPREPAARLGLPGVGRYTAGAIGSIAFGRQEPIVDGNVARVLCRIHGVDTPLGRADTERRLWTEATRLASGPRPGALNQALMELGATVCTPRGPACDRCPVRSACVARRTGAQATLPVPRPRRAPVPVALGTVVATRRGEVWLARAEGPLFAGLWQTPTAPERGPRAARATLRRLGLAARLAPRPIARLTHVLSHRELEVTVYRATHARATATAELRCVGPERLGGIGVSALTRRVLEAAGWPA